MSKQLTTTKKKPFLLKYSSTNSEGYKLVYSTNEIKAIEKLKKKLFFMTSLYVESATYQ